MQIQHPTVLLPEDHAHLERFMCTMTGSRSPLANLLKRKLETAVIVPPTAAPADLVTSGSRVRFAVDGGDAEERQLTWEPQHAAKPDRLSLQVPRGLAMLGLSAGDSVPYQREDGHTGIVRVQQVWPGTAGAPSPAGPRAGPLGRFLKAVLTRIQRGRTIAALERLDDVVLRDIGITRGEIPHVADMVAGIVPAPPPKAGSDPRPATDETAPRFLEAA